MAHAAKAAVGLTRMEANDIASYLIVKYADRQASKPIGKPFDQVYDLSSIEPAAEWQGIYEEVCAELATLGISLVVN
jgi:methylamine--corrinoid protein Co-methyltransferase